MIEANIKNITNTKTIRRKKKKKKLRMVDLPNEAKYLILQSYIDLPNKEFLLSNAKKYSVSGNMLSLFITEFSSNLLNKRESNRLLQAHHVSSHGKYYNYSPPSHINKRFLDLLSEDEDDVLTEAEYQFAKLLVETLDPHFSIIHTGLYAGLKKTNKEGETINQYNKRYTSLRARYLEQKPNVKAFIAELRDHKIEDMEDKMTPERLKVELFECYESAKARGDHRSTVALLRQLGESIALYKSTVAHVNINPSEVLDGLLELNKQDKLKITDIEDVEEAEIIEEG